MTPDAWLAILSRITRAEPIDLDAPAATPTGGVLAGAWPEGALPPSPRLWDRAEDGVSYLGIRVDAPLADVARAALRLAAAALERGVVPVILTSLPNSGFERFGFRVERFVAGTPAERALWEAEMTSFWNLALIVDAQDVAKLG